MQASALLQRTVYDDASRVALRLPLGETLGSLHPDGCFPLVEDPRPASRSTILGMMVLRPADVPRRLPASDDLVPTLLAGPDDWCFDVRGIGGSWPISAGNAVDAYRLALQYGVVDAVLAGATTIAREGMVAGARPGHLWQSYVPLSWRALRDHRGVLAPAISELRGQWREMGLLSDRLHPAQVALSSGREPADGRPDLLDARIFHDRHPDGTTIEAYIVTSDIGADRLRSRARKKGLDLEGRLLVASSSEAPDRLDVACIPGLLRQKLDARLVEHDGGAESLEAFLRVGAIAQLQLTLMAGRSVHEVISSTSRLDDAERRRLLESWKGRPRLFPLGGRGWQPAYALREDGTDGEAVVVTLDTRGTLAAQ